MPEDLACLPAHETTLVRGGPISSRQTDLTYSRSMAFRFIIASYHSLLVGNLTHFNYAKVCLVAVVVPQTPQTDMVELCQIDETAVIVDMLRHLGRLRKVLDRVFFVKMASIPAGGRKYKSFSLQPRRHRFSPELGTKRPSQYPYPKCNWCWLGNSEASRRTASDSLASDCQPTVYQGYAVISWTHRR